MISSFSDAGYLIPRLPHPRPCFFKMPVFQHLLGKCSLEIVGLGTQRLHFIAGGLTRRITRQTFLARFQKLL